MFMFRPLQPVEMCTSEVPKPLLARGRILHGNTLRVTCLDAPWGAYYRCWRIGSLQIFPQALMQDSEQKIDIKIPIYG